MAKSKVRYCVIVFFRTGRRERYIYLGEDDKNYYYKDCGRGNRAHSYLRKDCRTAQIFLGA